MVDYLKLTSKLRQIFLFF